MKKSFTLSMGKVSMLKIYAGAKNNYYAENMPGGGGGDKNNPPKQEI